MRIKASMSRIEYAPVGFSTIYMKKMVFIVNSLFSVWLSLI